MDNLRRAASRAGAHSLGGRLTIMDLSIIIPTYNRNSHLAECLQSLEHNDVEFIVIDDGSPNSVAVPPNVRLLRHDRNRGRAAAVNTGLKAASHNVVLIV